MSVSSTMIAKYNDYFYFLFRLLVGFLFLQHGGQKLFGWFGGVPMNDMMWVAGIIEFGVGLAIFFGLFTRVLAGLAVLEMVAAIIMFHLPQGWNPFIFPPGNGAELPLLYLAAFLIILIHGNGCWSLEQALLKKEVF